ncbi:elongation factor P [bacterium]|nr:elongation factor P [bacterium]
MLSLNAIKQGQIIILDKEPYLVLSTQHVHMGRGGATLRLKIKNLINGRVLNKNFQGNEKIKQADITRTKASFLYKDKDEVQFMNSSTYEQFSLPKGQIAEKINFLTEGLEVNILNFNNQPIGIELPPKVNLKVIEAPPAVRGDTAQGSVTKPITLETGLVINAPLFIKKGDIVKVNTETGDYVERV